MAARPQKVYGIVEPGKPTWWKANRHKVMFFLDCLITYLILHAFNSAGPRGHRYVGRSHALQSSRVELLARSTMSS